ncbi:MAG: hypothetical protein F4176_05845 [Acidimicrobiia bacterium]|nr:hypothetical protein [Acidimicrobiia bacterium]
MTTPTKMTPVIATDARTGRTVRVAGRGRRPTSHSRRTPAAATSMSGPEIRSTSGSSRNVPTQAGTPSMFQAGSPIRGPNTSTRTAPTVPVCTHQVGRRSGSLRMAATTSRPTAIPAKRCRP